MTENRLLLGDEAIALGAIHAGLSGVYAYPGTPSTEITEYIQNNPTARGRNIHSRWCCNEKTAMEAALGMSYAGKRALVCMKHVGMNVCADAFVNSAITGVNGGLVVLAADDPSMHSSQNEQDSRFYGKFALVPILEPTTQQEAYDMMPYAFQMSEKLKLPVLLRIVTRLAHSRASVAVSEPKPENPLHSDDQRTHWVLLPGNARRQYVSLLEKQPEIEKMAEEYSGSTLTLGEKGGLGVVACGIGYNYVREVAPQGVSILKVNQYPLPIDKVKTLADHGNPRGGGRTTVRRGTAERHPLCRISCHRTSHRTTASHGRVESRQCGTGIRRTANSGFPACQEPGRTSAAALSGMRTPRCIYRPQAGGGRI